MSSLQAAIDVLRPFGAAVVTGGSSGIGKSFISTVAEANPEVRVCNLSRGIPDLPGVQSFICDFASREARRTVFPRVAAWAEGEAETGRLLLINNSGFGCFGPFPEPKVCHHLEMLEVNIAAVLELTAELLPLLRRRGGAIVNVASTSAFQPTPWLQTYGASKAFLLHWSAALAHELKGSGVQVLTLCPGPTRTRFQLRETTARGPLREGVLETPEQVVATAFRALRRGRSVVVSGRWNRLLAALARRLPIALAARLAGGVIARQRPSLPPAG